MNLVVRWLSHGRHLKSGKGLGKLKLRAKTEERRARRKRGARSEERARSKERARNEERWREARSRSEEREARSEEWGVRARSEELSYLKHSCEIMFSENKITYHRAISCSKVNIPSLEALILLTIIISPKQALIPKFIASFSVLWYIASRIRIEANWRNRKFAELSCVEHYYRQGNFTALVLHFRIRHDYRRQRIHKPSPFSNVMTADPFLGMCIWSISPPPFFRRWK